MDSRVRDILLLVAGLAVVLAAAFGGYAAVRARAQGSGTSQALAPVARPKPPAPGAVAPQYDRWTVGKAAGPVTVYRRADTSSPVQVQLGRVNQHDYPTLVLVDSIKDVGGEAWYRVWLPMRPNESRGGYREGQAGVLHDDRQDRHRPLRAQAPVYRRGELVGSYAVAVGQARPSHTDRVSSSSPRSSGQRP